MRYKVGQLVVNKKLGLGKILSVSGTNVTAFFKDQKENPRTINVGVVPMALAEEQSDATLDGIDDRGKQKSRSRKKDESAGAPAAKAKKAKKPAGK